MTFTHNLTLNIRRARPEDFEACCAILSGTELAARYYPSRRYLEQAVRSGMENDRFLVADDLKSGGPPVGFVWYQEQGMFHAFPYLHMIAVCAQREGEGIGSALLQAYENEALTRSGGLRTRAFLLVADFNERAMRMYRRKGYEPVGQFPGLFRRNVRETCMMKIVTRTSGTILTVSDGASVKGMAADD